eukprot:RCo014895
MRRILREWWFFSYSRNGKAMGAEGAVGFFRILYSFFQHLGMGKPWVLRGRWVFSYAHFLFLFNWKRHAKGAASPCAKGANRYFFCVCVGLLFFCDIEWSQGADTSSQSALVSFLLPFEGFHLRLPLWVFGHGRYVCVLVVSTFCHCGSLPTSSLLSSPAALRTCTNKGLPRK